MSGAAAEPPTMRLTVRLLGLRHSNRDPSCACAPPPPTVAISAAASSLQPIAETPVHAAICSSPPASCLPRMGPSSILRQSTTRYRR